MRRGPGCPPALPEEAQGPEAPLVPPVWEGSVWMVGFEAKRKGRQKGLKGFKRVVGQGSRVSSG